MADTVVCDANALMECAVLTQVEESREVMDSVLIVMRGSPPLNTFDSRSTACWSTFKKVWAMWCQGMSGWVIVATYPLSEACSR